MLSSLRFMDDEIEEQLAGMDQDSSAEHLRDEEDAAEPPHAFVEPRATDSVDSLTHSELGGATLLVSEVVAAAAPTRVSGSGRASTNGSDGTATQSAVGAAGAVGHKCKRRNE
jgi:hypothetical protein